MLTHVLMATQLFLGATSTYSPNDNPVVKLKADPVELISLLKSKAEKGDGEAAFKLHKIYLEEKNNVEWRFWLQKSADLNYPEGEYFSGLILFQKKSATDEEKAEGLKYYLSAARKGNADAQATLGDCYLFGDAVEKDEKQALYWYQLAAKQNHSIATNNLAIFHDTGRAGLKIDKFEALKLYSRAAYLGSNYAQNTMGVFYANGSILDRNKAEAFAWMWIAADNESENALENLKHLAANLTPDQYFKGRKRITEIQELITKGKCDQPIVLKQRDFKNPTIDKTEQEEIEKFKSNLVKAQSGDAQAQLKVAKSYKFGDGVEENDKEAFYWFEKAAKQGLAQAQCSLGMIYAVGNSFVKPNPQESIKWFELSAAQNEVEAIYSLGVSYQNGIGVKVNEQKFLEYYKKAADLGHETAQSNYANYFLSKVLEKNGTEADKATALKYLKLSAKQMHRESLLKLGVYYYIIKDDPVEGLAWFYLTFNSFCYKRDAVETFLRDAPPEIIDKAQKRSDQIAKELLQKNLPDVDK